MEFVTLPDRRAAHDPHGPALADKSGSLTNSELLGAVQAATRRLDGLGIGVGDVVALKLANQIEFVVLLFAAWRVGATITPVNPNLTDVEVARQLDDSGARLLIVEDEDATTSGVSTLAASEIYDVAGADPSPHADPSALALLIYTSGTTGVPKGVMLDHANLDAMAAMGRQALELDTADRCLLILPLFHVNGIVVSVLTPLLAGASVVIADRFNPTTFFQTIELARPTYFSAVPTIYSMLAALPEDVKPDTSSLRFAVCGAAPASAELLTRFQDRYGFPILEGYGLSEGTCGSTLNPVDGPRKAGTVGVPFPGQELRIVDADGNGLPPGTDGEVVVRGPNVMRGYLGRPDDTAAVIRDGWLYTGDVGHLGADGYLTLVGRSKEMIIRGGENIYPKEIEDVLASDPTVLEAAVIGVPDETWGEVVMAFVQARPEATIDLDALKARCRTGLSAYKRPKVIRVLDALPKNAVGKLDKKSLRQIPSEGRLT
ncbi:MAG: AMP-binding protein [Actinomycetota bacterium]|nr:AMP-binding protein [Actinomycetota bacterium]